MYAVTPPIIVAFEQVFYILELAGFAALAGRPGTGTRVLTILMFGVVQTAQARCGAPSAVRYVIANPMPGPSPWTALRVGTSGCPPWLTNLPLLNPTSALQFEAESAPALCTWKRTAVV